jgi:hypothetical protein
MVGAAFPIILAVIQGRAWMARASARTGQNSI